MELIYNNQYYMEQDNKTTFSLGRNVQFDERSRNFPIRSLMTAPQYKPRSYTWNCVENLNQGRDGACTGFSWAHELIARPAQVKDIGYDEAMAIYKRAQFLDPWEGEDYEGSSVLAAVKAVQELHPNKILEYRWCFSFDDIVKTLGYFGPIVLGVNWYYNMFFPDENGIITVGGYQAGGHAILANGINVKKQLVRLHNSWGPEWGVNGEAFISFNDLRQLMSEQGEACVAVKRNI